MRSPNTAAVLYLCTEDGGTEFCKVGMTDRASNLYDRLRTLNQGNPRNLRFDRLWIGPPDSIARLEAMVKDRKRAVGGTGRTEWYRENPDDMARFLRDTISGDRSVVEWIDDNCIPYNAKNPGECPINRHYFTGKPLIPQVLDRLGA